MKYKFLKLHLDLNRIKITLVISPSKFVATHTSNNHQTCRSKLIVEPAIQRSNSSLPSPLIKPRREISSSLSRLILYNKCPPPPCFAGGEKRLANCQTRERGNSQTETNHQVSLMEWINATPSEVDERHVSYRLLLTTRQSNN